MNITIPNEDEPLFVEVERVGEKLVHPLTHQIAEGGCASVFRSIEIADTKRTVAIKLVHCDPQDVDRGAPSLLQRFKDEVRTWNKFSGSRHVVRLYYTFRHVTTGSVPRCFLGFVMEYSEMGDLQKNLIRLGEFFPRKKDIHALLLGITAAIKEGHDNDITHGDIKPHNVLLFPSEGTIIAKVMDFGMGFSSDMDFTKYGGTPEYLAPERFGVEASFNKPADVPEAKCSDLYSLGVLFYQLLTGTRPYQISPSEIDDERWIQYGRAHRSGGADFRCLEEKAGPALADLVRKMMAVEPKDRPTLIQVIRRLQGIQQEGMTDSAREEECPVARKTYRWNPQVHQTLGERLHYYFIRGRSPNGDPIWFKNHLEEERIRAFSFYRILGGFDYILRVWAKPSQAERVESVMEKFKGQHRTDFQRFLVVEAEPFFGRKALKGLVGSDLLAAIESCADRDREKEFLALQQKGFVGGRLSDFPPGTIRAFIGLSVQGEGNEALLRMYSSEIRRALENETTAKDVSIYRGSGAFQILCKIRLERFQEFRQVYEEFLRTCEYIRVGDFVINSQSFFELDEAGFCESDDGSIVGDLLSRMDSDYLHTESRLDHPKWT